MTQMAFVWAAYAITLAGTAAVTLSAYVAMRRAEKADRR